MKAKLKSYSAFRFFLPFLFSFIIFAQNLWGGRAKMLCLFFRSLSLPCSTILIKCRCNPEFCISLWPALLSSQGYVTVCDRSVTACIWMVLFQRIEIKIKDRIRSISKYLSQLARDSGPDLHRFQLTLGQNWHIFSPESQAITTWEIPHIFKGELSSGLVPSCA